MSYSTLFAQSIDEPFRQRITASLQQEARTDVHAGDPTAEQILAGTSGIVTYFVWSVSNATADAYAYAVNAGNPNPGGDESVVTDADILAAVQAAWPTAAP